MINLDMKSLKNDYVHARMEISLYYVAGNFFAYFHKIMSETSLTLIKICVRHW